MHIEYSGENFAYYKLNQNLMSQISEQSWYQAYVTKMIATHGDMPPPWVFRENSHPYSLDWRMGGGETHVMALHEWWQQQNYSV